MRTETSEQGGRHKPPNLADRLRETGGRPTGFDYLRLVLALSVVALHSVITTKGIAADIRMWLTPLRPLLRAVLPMFFALSGFLVTGSLERCRSLVSFLGLRIIRIYPALAVEVVLSALLIGPLVTKLPLRAYLADHQFHAYFLNILGDIHFSLPGVFLGNPVPGAVNLQLWTVPYELGCYIALATVAVAGALKRPYLVPGSALLICLLYFGGRILKHHGDNPFVVGAVPGPLLIVAFLYGVAAYLYRDRTPFDARLAAAAAVLGAVSINGLPGGVGDFFAVPLLTYLTVYLGLCSPRRMVILRGADYSYGVFLYGFVIQQLVSHLLPAERVWWFNLLISVPAAVAFAALSWHWIEKPALRLRAPLLRFEAWTLERMGTWRPWPRNSPPAGARAR